MSAAKTDTPDQIAQEWKELCQASDASGVGGSICRGDHAVTPTTRAQLEALRTLLTDAESHLNGKKGLNDLYSVYVKHMPPVVRKDIERMAVTLRVLLNNDVEPRSLSRAVTWSALCDVAATFGSVMAVYGGSWFAGTMTGVLMMRQAGIQTPLAGLTSALVTASGSIFMSRAVRVANTGPGYARTVVASADGKSAVPIARSTGGYTLLSMRFLGFLYNMLRVSQEFQSPSTAPSASEATERSIVVSEERAYGNWLSAATVALFMTVIYLAWSKDYAWLDGRDRPPVRGPDLDRKETRSDAVPASGNLGRGSGERVLLGTLEQLGNGWRQAAAPFRYLGRALLEAPARTLYLPQMIAFARPYLERAVCCRRRPGPATAAASSAQPARSHEAAPSAIDSLFRRESETPSVLARDGQRLNNLLGVIAPVTLARGVSKQFYHDAPLIDMLIDVPFLLWWGKAITDNELTQAENPSIARDIKAASQRWDLGMEALGARRLERKATVPVAAHTAVASADHKAETATHSTVVEIRPHGEEIDPPLPRGSQPEPAHPNHSAGTRYASGQSKPPFGSDRV